jgi:hypothetical protein
MIPGIQEIQKLALKYSKPQLASMAQSGLIDTQKAVLAAMMRDRISKEDAKPPTTTVAQDVMGMQPQMAQQPQQPQQPMMAQQALQARPQMGAMEAPAPETPTQMAATGGLTSIPIKSEDYAGGGIVAFAKGGDTPYKVYEYNPKFMEETPISTFDLEKQRQLDMQKAFGIDPEFYKKRGEEVGLEREKLTKEKSGSLADALIVGGLGVAAGNSPYALQNIATGATKGFESYQGQMKDIRERDKALIESQNRIKEAEYLRTIGQGEAADKAIQESKKLNREAKNMNIGIQNEVYKETAKSQTDASKTGYTEGEATRRIKLQTANAMAIAKLPPAELRMVQALNDQEVAIAKKEGKPEPTLMQTLESMSMAKYKGYGGGTGKTYQDYVEDWNKMKISKDIDFKEKHPEIDTPEKYADFMMTEQAKFNSKGQRVTPPDSGTAPPAMPTELPAGAPAGSRYGAHTPMGWQILSKDGTLIGYGQK